MNWRTKRLKVSAFVICALVYLIARLTDTTADRADAKRQTMNLYAELQLGKTVSNTNILSNVLSAIQAHTARNGPIISWSFDHAYAQITHRPAVGVVRVHRAKGVFQESLSWYDGTCKRFGAWPVVESQHASK